MNPPPATTVAPAAAELSLRDYLRIVFHHRLWLFLSVLLVALLAAVAYRQFTTPVYRAACLLLLQPTRARVVDVKEVYDPTFGADAGNTVLRREYMETQYSLILSRPNLDSLYNDPALGFAAMPKFTRATDPIDKFRKLFAVKGLPNSYVAEVAFEWSDPAVAKETVTKLVEQYLRSTRERSLGVTSSGLEALRVKAEDLRPKLAAKAAELQQVIATHNMVSLDQSQDIIVERLKTLNRQVGEAEAKRIAVESRFQSVQTVVAANSVPGNMPEIVDNPVIRDLKLEHVRAALQLSQLTGSLGPKHPDVLATAAAVKNAEAAIAAETRSILAAVEAEYTRAVAQEKALRQELATQEQAIMAFNRLTTEYRVLKDEHAQLLRGHTAVTERISEIEIALAAGSGGDGVFVVAPAREPVKPVRPKSLWLALALALAAGSFFGVGLCFLVDYLDSTVKTREEAETIGGAAVLGYVPAIGAAVGMGTSKGKGKGKGKGKVADDLIVVNQPRSVVAESFRSMRTALAFTNAEAGPGPRLLGVTSALPGEGKSIVSINLAVTLALGGQRVLLVDADMRRARLHKAFHLDAKPGLSNLLAGENATEMARAIRPTGVPGLDLLPSGHMPPNPAELLGSLRLEALIKQLAERYDCILFDTPPVGAVTDAIVLGRRLHGLLLVVRSFRTDREALALATHTLRQNGIRVAGLVLNGIDIPRTGYRQYAYGYGYYGRYHYYGEGTKAGDEPAPAPPPAASGPG